ncbi:Putative zinc metalloprotease Rip3 [Methanosarcinales archaeon]|nr:CBS domain-containing protein [Candidatus Methanoperedens sp.]CAG0948090.1 Putative zinc metalloprotease Rip3 [Methanosarcinales archaeon]
MNLSIQIGKLMGIPIKLHVTFLLILPVFGYIFANNPPGFGFRDIGPLWFRYALGLSVALLLFTCVLLHELGHSYVAKKHGSNIQGITLFLFGGVSSLEDIPRNPKIEFKMALAGPAVSLLIGSILIIFYGILKVNIPMSNPYLRLMEVIGYINVVLCVFNLLPAFPMDGGRVLRAALADRMSYMKATHIAAYVGKMFAILMGIFGFITVPDGVWFMLIAFFIYIGASEEEKSTQVSITLEGMKMKDIMSEDVKTVPSTMTVEELVDFMFKHKHMGYPVVDGAEIKGIVTFTDVQNIPKEKRKTINVSNIMTKEIISTKEDDEAVKALKIMTTNNIGRIIITQDKKIIGIVSRTDLLRSVQLLE